jgi:hypothetical protein
MTLGRDSTSKIVSGVLGNTPENRATIRSIQKFGKKSDSLDLLVETCQGPRCKTSVHEVRDGLTSSEHADHGKGTRTSRASATGEENDDLETQHRKTNKDRKQDEWFMAGTFGRTT